MASDGRGDRECAVPCSSRSFCSNCLELKIVWKILSRSPMETGLHRRHSCIISTPHTPSTFVHIHSPFLLLTCISNLNVNTGDTQINKSACHCCCFRFGLLLIYYTMKTEQRSCCDRWRGQISVHRNRKEWERSVFKRNGLQGCRNVDKEDKIMNCLVKVLKYSLETDPSDCCFLFL